MARATKILDIKRLLAKGRYKMEAVVWKIPIAKKFPQGVKCSFRLLDLEHQTIRLLVDNHEPHGFHMHTKLPENHQEIILLCSVDYLEALEIFELEVRRILENE